MVVLLAVYRTLADIFLWFRGVTRRSFLRHYTGANSTAWLHHVMYILHFVI